jgi:uncharacterized repeat protein (TIGR03803 family)
MTSRLRYGATLTATAAFALGAGLTIPPASAAARLDAIYSFCAQQGCPDGDQPYGGVTLLSANHLIGTTGFGGAYNGGTVFALTQKHRGAKLKTLQDICAGTPPNCQHDEGPSTTLVEDTSGNIYGSEYFGGTDGYGAVFELEAKSPSRYKLHVLYSFNGTDGYGPGNLSYAGQGSGALYDGKSPLYGATIAGGTGSSGIVFSLAPQNGKWTLATLYNFCSANNCSDGGLPEAAPIVDPATGNLYGTTNYYGADNGGTIYKLANANGNWSYSLLYTFCSAANCSDGSGSYAGLAEDAGGDFYGTTYFGGAQGDGVAFELAKGGQYSVLHDFCSEGGCGDGAQPAAAVTLDAAGNLYGTTGRGGNGNYGVLFEIAGGKYKRVYSFCAANGCGDGGYPYGTLALDSSGYVWGTTQYGGAYGLGEVYRLKP